MIDPGKLAYEGYSAYSDNKSLVSGEPLPTWEEQSEEIRGAWRAAADVVVMYVTSSPGNRKLPPKAREGMA
jgi:hypothetical protein